MPMQPDEHESVPFQADESSKNPIRVILRDYKGPIPIENLVSIVASSRDYFHTFVSMTLRRRYRRLVPIYLVDEWVIRALGIFMAKGRRCLPPAASFQTRAETKFGDFDLSAEVHGVGPWIEFFKALHGFDELLGHVQIIKLADLRSQIRATAVAALDDSSKRQELQYLISEAANIVAKVGHRLRTSKIVDKYLNESFVNHVISAKAALLIQLNRLPTGTDSWQLPEIPGISFGEQRPSGILFGSIPSLDISGPAILLSPTAIIGWSQQSQQGSIFMDRVPLPGLESWFGVSRSVDIAAVVAISDVVLHELTHAMIALPNDPVQKPSELFAAHWKFYSKAPGFEEGFCDALAVIATGIMLLKAAKDLKGKELPRLEHSTNALFRDTIFPSLQWLYQDYYGKETNDWLNAWTKNKYDFGAFAGLVKMYSTNISDMNWDATYAAMQQGVISTTRTNQG
jgi:hypothetical protein